MSEQWLVKSVKDLDPVLKHMKELLKVGDIVLFRGEVGAGKTTLINHFAKALGIDNSNSPTFAIHNLYQTSDVKIHHLDLYRISNEEDLESTGLADFMADKNSIVFIEWPERLVKSQLPRQRRVFELSIKLKNDDREIFWREV
ncbi:MAG: tRNA (adenosine(37)-N6)-threonylcarbamoyltransferase complex ATPase subunit type 1 TsaE [Bdellovibrionales bacterium]|nr:tRNA (adenosine(37)-N6)-threonylcarbamoyltransferase complex ATPase subunit type 1 TsaE [Bdellovibrionales bacterium]